MSDPLNYQTPTLVLPFKNKSGFLIAAGILLLLTSILAGCGILSIPLAALAPKRPGQVDLHAGQIVSVTLMYAVLTTVLAWLGIGTLMKRRWSRPLVMILTTHWLLMGVISTIVMVAIFPMLRDQIATDPNMPPGVAGIALMVSLLMIVVMLVALPGVILWLVKSDDARLTVEYFDPTPRWTDQCPLKILGLTLTLWVAGIFFGLMAFQPVLPIFGTMLQGAAAVGIALAIAAALILAGYWVYRMDMRGWWLGLLAIVLPVLAALPTLLFMPVIDWYRAAGTPEQQLVQIAKHATIIRVSSVAIMMLLVIGFVIYMLRLLPQMKPIKASL